MRQMVAERMKCALLCRPAESSRVATRAQQHAASGNP